jgi:uncharacterized membrane protein (UPF0127 family)
MIYVKTRHRRTARLLGLVPAAMLAAALASAPAVQAQGRDAVAGEPQRLQAIQLTAGMHVIRAELAITPEQRQKGLMFRRDLGANDGMLFVFEQPMPQCFWMKNTPTPLTIAFLADDGAIVNLADMQPFDERSHCSAKPVRYVLEMHQGWFAKRGLKPGFKLAGPPFQR